jgi:hypothetical protein
MTRKNKNSMKTNVNYKYEDDFERYRKDKLKK